MNITDRSRSAGWYALTRAWKRPAVCATPIPLVWACHSFGLLVVFGCVCAAADDRSGESYSLPDDPQTIVLELAFEESSSTESAAPAVQVRADGRVIVPAGPGGGRTLYGELPADELRSLLREILETQQFLKIDSDAVAAAVEQAGRRSRRDWRIQNAATSVIHVRLKDSEHEVRCNAAELLRERFPDVPDLARLCAVQRRLQNVRAVVEVGGNAEAQRLAELATGEVRRESANGAEVTARDLLHVRSSGDGLRQVQFRVESTPESGDQAEVTMISIFESPESLPRVSVTTVPARQ